VTLAHVSIHPGLRYPCRGRNSAGRSRRAGVTLLRGATSCLGPRSSVDGAAVCEIGVGVESESSRHRLGVENQSFLNRKYRPTDLEIALAD
jgi:hypothetical protein